MADKVNKSPERNIVEDDSLRIGTVEFSNICNIFIRGFTFLKGKPPKSIVLPTVEVINGVEIKFDSTSVVEELDSARQTNVELEARIEELTEQLSQVNKKKVAKQ